MDIKTLVRAVSSIPHIGAILAVTITIGIGIYEEVKVRGLITAGAEE